MNSQLKAKVSASYMLHQILMVSWLQGEELGMLEKTSSEKQLELQNELASLQMSSENLTNELSRKEHQLTEVMI